MQRLAIALALILTTASAFAAETPEAVVKRQLDAMHAGDWEKFTACMHPPALKEFQTTVMDVVSKAPDSPTREQLMKSFFADKSIAELQAVTPSVFFGMFMNGLAQTNPAIKQSMTNSEGQVLGHVDEGPDKTHVLMRMTVALADSKVVKMDVTSLQRDGDTWKALLKGDMQAIVVGLNKMLQAK